MSTVQQKCNMAASLSMTGSFKGLEQVHSLALHSVESKITVDARRQSSFHNQSTLRIIPRLCRIFLSFFF